MEKHNAVYCRISGSHNQDMASQRSALQEKTKHLNNVVWYEDELSGKNTKRPDYQKLLNLINGGLIEKVYTWKYDRIGRNASDNLVFANACKARNTDIVSVSDGMTLLSPTGLLLFTILSAIAEYEREKIVENTLRGMAHAREMGKVFGGSLKGWTAQDTIRKLPTMLLLREQGKSLRYIAEQVSMTRKAVTRALKLNDEGKVIDRAKLIKNIPIEKRGKKFQREQST